MSTQSQVQPDADAAAGRKPGEQLAAAVGASVMRGLGRPRDLFRVAAVRLWGNHYRVNVQTGPDAVSVRIAHSFFVEADDKGNVLGSVPALERRY
jgi:hypothetical protein